MPRPLSATRHPPSARSVTSLRVASPAMASSTELSTTSQMRWCRPLGPVDPMYMPGRLRTGSRPSRTVMSLAPYDEAGLAVSTFCFSATGATFPTRSRNRQSHQNPQVRSPWGPIRIGQAWAELMRRLGYTRYVAQGGDVGSQVTDAMGRLALDGLIGIHTNLLTPALGDADALSESPPSTAERAALDALAEFHATGTGYFVEQATRPETIGYA